MAVVLLVRRLDQGSSVRLVGSGGGRERVEGDVGRPPRARVEGRNLELAGLGWSSLDSEQEKQK